MTLLSAKKTPRMEKAEASRGTRGSLRCKPSEDQCAVGLYSTRVKVFFPVYFSAGP